MRSPILYLLLLRFIQQFEGVHVVPGGPHLHAKLAGVGGEAVLTPRAVDDLTLEQLSDPRHKHRLERALALDPDEHQNLKDWLEAHAHRNCGRDRTKELDATADDVAKSRGSGGAKGFGSISEARQELEAKGIKDMNIQTLGVVIAAVVIFLAGRCVGGKQHWASPTIAFAFALVIPGWLCVAVRSEILVYLFPEGVAGVKVEPMYMNLQQVTPMTDLSMVRRSDVGLAGLLRVELPEKLVLTELWGHPGFAQRSILQYVSYLWLSGSELAAALLVAVAFIGPVVIVVCLGVYWCSMLGTDRHARAVEAIQVVAKLTCVGSFALIFLQFLFVSMNHPPEMMVLTLLDVGFTCYTAFSILLTIASGFLATPEAAKDGESRSPTAPLILRYTGRRGVFVAVVIMASVWALLFALALFRPCFHVLADEDAVLKSQAVDIGIPECVLKPAMRIMKIRVEELFDHRLCIWDCLGHLWRAVGESGDVNMLLAALAVNLFGVASSVVSVFALVWEGCWLGRGKGIAIGKRPEGKQVPSRALSVLRQLCMCDAMILGVVYVLLSARMYRGRGLFLSLEVGTVYLILSEVAHRVLFWIVYGTSAFVENQTK